MEGLHKLSSPWEGPFIIAKVTGPGLYRLQTLEGDDISVHLYIYKSNEHDTEVIKATDQARQGFIYINI
jgi:hypothetical protein